ncbi:MAG: glycyl-radical enzyme activating protein [Deltaproteobacteria bacterium]|nr:glycyl-radical enzyme activating protein [Deltaproteobacteria bacterium]
MVQNSIPDSVHATVLEIQRMSTEDGPGIRTTVFFKGCSLQCRWCHNPESISRRPQVQWIGNRCIGCRTCLDACDKGAISVTPEAVSINRALCNGCGVCAEECPSTALELLGKKWALHALVEEVIKDRAYFEKSGGGVTLSGGEPTVQAKFAGALLKGLKRKGIQTAFDTCGLCTQEALDELLPFSNMVLYDIKDMDSERHKTFTGSGNDKILENLIYVSRYIRSHLHPRRLWVRTPIIPHATAREDNIRGIGHFISSHLGDTVSRWELCSFNNLCRDKYARLGLDWAFKDSELMDKRSMERLARVARDSGVDPDIVLWSGSTRIHD